MPHFQPRERKHKRLAKQKRPLNQTSNSNAEVIVPETQSERDIRRNAIKEQLRAQQPESKISSKKRKRLDKYIDTKLKKEENAELLKKLASQQVDTNLFRSSKTLGRGHESQKERFQRALNERKAGIDVDGEGDEILFEGRRAQEDEDSEESEDEIEQAGGVALSSAPVEPVTSTASFGSGLKRPLDLDDTGRPVIQKRKRRKKEKPSHSLATTNREDDESSGQTSDVEADSSGEEWNGFDSEVAGKFSEDEGSDASSSPEHNNEDSDSAASSEDEAAVEQDPNRVSAFKAWADSQRNAAIGFTPSALPTHDAALKANFHPRAPSPDPLVEAITITAQTKRWTQPLSAITIARSEGIQTARLELPVVQEEQNIIEAVNNHPVVIICGSTGSGKTTQVPQMLFENGYGSLVGTSMGADKSTPGNPSKGLIGITQPRRVAATSVASRVSYELGAEHRNRVAHQVRYDTNVGKDTAIKFMTDGILLREIQQDFPLSRYSVIVIDEAHERSVNTDLLIGLLSRIVPLRTELAAENPENWHPLKLVIMSATLRVTDFLQNGRLFKSAPPPIVEVEGRQFDVTEHFARRTKRDYLSEIVEKVSRGHRKLPPGGMLVFLTGQQEIQTVAKRLKERLGGSAMFLSHGGDGHGRSGDLDDLEDMPLGAEQKNKYLEGEEPQDDDDNDSEVELRLEDDDEFEVEDHNTAPHRPTTGTLKAHILPLYAALSTGQQRKVFEPAPEGNRQIILATNVAETSLTIPGIRFVFDSGRSKEKRYDPASGIQTFEVDWISKASALQRKGRAGRTGPGHVWRLYSSAVYEQFFADHTDPEILRTPLESVVLQLKGMNIENVVNFPFPTSPNRAMLEQAERLLWNLGAIEQKEGARITETGKELMRFPVSPRFGKMLVLARRNQVEKFIAADVAGLAVGDLFIPEAQSSTRVVDDAGGSERSDDDEEANPSDYQHRAYSRAHATLSRWDDRSDAVKLLTAVAAHAEAQSKSETSATAFCKEFFLREKGMSEVQMLRRQLHALSSNNGEGARNADFRNSIILPTDKERAMINQIIAAGFIDQVAIRADMLKDESVSFGRKPRRAIEVPYRTLVPTVMPEEVDRNAAPADQEIQKSVFIHPSSVLAHLAVKEMPQYIVYSHLSRAAPSGSEQDTGKRKKTRMHPLTTVGPKALAALAENTPLLEFGKPIGRIEELDVGRRQCWVGLTLRAPKSHGESAWPLGAWKVVQKRDKKGVWDVEKVIAR